MQGYGAGSLAPTTDPRMDRNANKLTEVLCPNCRAFIGRRLFNRLIAFGIDIIFTRSADIVCHQCGRTTRFCVDRQSETVLQVRVENQS